MASAATAALMIGSSLSVISMLGLLEGGGYFRHIGLQFGVGFLKLRQPLVIVNLDGFARVGFEHHLATVVGFQNHLTNPTNPHLFQNPDGNREGPLAIDGKDGAHVGMMLWAEAARKFNHRTENWHYRILQLPQGAEGFENFGDLLGAFGALFAEKGGEGFGVGAVGGEEFLEGGDLGC